MRMVLDTDVLVAAFRSERGASRQLLIAALDQRFVLLASTAIWGVRSGYDTALTIGRHAA
jgi:predicted nucleic acid-binding protein